MVTMATVRTWGSTRTSDDDPEQRLRGSSVPKPIICDEAALGIDAAVSEVCQALPKAGECLCHYWLIRPSVVHASREVGVSRRKAAELIRIGESGVGAALAA